MCEKSLKGLFFELKFFLGEKMFVGFFEYVLTWNYDFINLSSFEIQICSYFLCRNLNEIIFIRNQYFLMIRGLFKDFLDFNYK